MVYFRKFSSGKNKLLILFPTYVGTFFFTKKVISKTIIFVTDTCEDSFENTPVIYRWDDESNGEIYTDRPNQENDTQTPDNEQPEDILNQSSIGLYVVENGKEYPLLPISQRKSLFEPNPSVKLSFRAATSTSNLAAASNSSLTKTASSILASKEETVISRPIMIKSQEKRNISIEPPIKSASVPYIMEEQEVLQNIDLVAKIKTKFVA